MKALFLDRDGVINEDFGYVYKKDDFKFKKGIFKLLTKAKNLGFSFFIVTNQSGIGRGFYNEKDFKSLTYWVKEQFNKKGIIIQKTYFCPHHPIHGVGSYKKNCQCRKPNSLLFEKAKIDFNIDISKSIMIGDKESDLIAAKKAGVTKLILLNKYNNQSKKEYIMAKSIEEISSNFFNIAGLN
jgi:D-glycero-D-manno-heptose 1,7-bisphosphate phosphatase